MGVATRRHIFGTLVSPWHHTFVRDSVACSMRAKLAKKGCYLEDCISDGTSPIAFVMYVSPELIRQLRFDMLTSTGHGCRSKGAASAPTADGSDDSLPRP